MTMKKEMTLAIRRAAMRAYERQGVKSMEELESRVYESLSSHYKDANEEELRAMARRTAYEMWRDKLQ